MTTQTIRQQPPAGETVVYRDSTPFVVGQATTPDKGQRWQIVTRCGRYRISHDEDDWDMRYRYWAHVRPATETEATHATERRTARTLAAAARAEAARALRTGEAQGRDWQQPAGCRILAHEPQGGSTAAKDYLLAALDGTVYTVDPIYDDGPCVYRLALTPDQAVEAARVAGWTLVIQTAALHPQAGGGAMNHPR